MNTAWGVYNLQGRLDDGTMVDDKARLAARWSVRWRVNGNPHKRTFKQKGHAASFREELLRAKVMGWPADHRGWPISPQTIALQEHTTGPPGTSDTSRTAPNEFATATPTFERYCLDTWYPNRAHRLGAKNRIGHRSNMRFAIAALRYTDQDPRLDPLSGRVPGASLLLTDITPDDVHAALARRAQSNARTASMNERAIQKAFARGDTDVTTLPEVASASTVHSFFVTLGMILRAAKRSHPGLGDALDGTAPSAPKPKTARMSRRIVPSIDEVFDLADAIAQLGPRGRDGRPAGERFRALVLCAGTLAPRPGELTAHMPDWIDWNDPVVVRFHNSEVPIYDTEEGLAGFFVHPLKHRVDGDWREVPALNDVAAALRAHLENGYGSADRTFTGPRGAKVNWGNMRDNYWAPACDRVFGGTSKASLATMTPKTLRKAAITHWLDAGINPFLAAEWAGHSEDVARRYYAGRTSETYAREAALLAESFTTRSTAGN